MSKFLIPVTDEGMTANSDGSVVYVDSRVIAEKVGKEHRHVLRDIEAATEKLDKIIEPTSGRYSIDNYFVKSSYKAANGKRNPCYFVSEQGFMLLLTHWKTDNAFKISIEYAAKFDAMRSFCKQLVVARKDFPILTAAIKFMHGDNAKPYHFSNECDMLNRMAIGCTARQYRLNNELDKNEQLRPHLTEQQLAVIDDLQQVDRGLLLSGIDYHARKEKLELYMFHKWHDVARLTLLDAGAL